MAYTSRPVEELAELSGQPVLWEAFCREVRKRAMVDSVIFSFLTEGKKLEEV